MFSFTETLHDYLLGGHGGDATKLSNWVRFFKSFTDSLTFSFTFWDFSSWIVSQTIFNDFFSDEDRGITGFAIKYGADIHILFALFFTPSGGNGSFNNIQNSFFWEILLFGDNFHHLRHLFKVQTFHIFLSFSLKYPTLRPDIKSIYFYYSEDNEIVKLKLLPKYYKSVEYCMIKSSVPVMLNML